MNFLENELNILKNPSSINEEGKNENKMITLELCINDLMKKIFDKRGHFGTIYIQNNRDYFINFYTKKFLLNKKEYLQLIKMFDNYCIKYERLARRKFNAKKQIFDTWGKILDFIFK